MDLKEKLKEILKKNYGITSDAELLEELNNMESVDLGIFVTQIDAEKTAYMKEVRNCFQQKIRRNIIQQLREF